MPDHPPTAHPVPDFEYLEDPAVIQTLTLMSRQWPLLTGAADHPLTEHFIRRSPRGTIDAFRSQLGLLLDAEILKGLALLLVYVWMYLVISPGLLSFRYTPADPLLVAFVVVILPGVTSLLISYAQFRSRRGNARSIATPERILYLNALQREPVWLTGLKLRALIGVSAACQYWRASRLSRVRAKLCIAIIGVNALAAIIMVAAKTPMRWLQLPFMMMAVEIVLLNFICDPGIAVYTALANIRRAIAPRRRIETRAAALILKYSMLWVLLPYCLFFVLLIGFLISGLAFAGAGSIWAFSWFLIVLFTAATESNRRINGSRINQLYSDIKHDQHLYESRLMPHLFVE